MKKILRIVGQTVCILLVAAGLLAALFATFCVGTMVFVWIHEGALQPMDQTILAAGAKWLLGSCASIGAAWWLRGKIGNKTADNSFRLVESEPGHLEKVVQNVFFVGSIVILALHLWPRIPGSTFMKLPAVAGWLVAGFFGSHVLIALHELGHLGAAWLVGFDLRKIQVGTGPLLWSRTFANGLIAHWRVWPLHGFVSGTPQKTEGYRARQSFVVTAGPLANLIILWATYELITSASGGLVAALGQGAGGLMAFLFFWWTVLATLGSIIPQRVRLDHTEVWTDAYWLVRLWTGSVADITDLARSLNWRELLQLYQSDCPPRQAPQESADPELRASLAKPMALREHRALLSSRLLRKTETTSSLPA